MTTLLMLLLLAVMPAAVQPCGYLVRASSYPYATVNLSADAEGDDFVVWQLPSVVQQSVTSRGHYASIWVVGADEDGRSQAYWAGKFEASYTVYRAGRPPRRVEFFVIVR